MNVHNSWSSYAVVGLAAARLGELLVVHQVVFVEDRSSYLQLFKFDRHRYYAVVWSCSAGPNKDRK